MDTRYRHTRTQIVQSISDWVSSGYTWEDVLEGRLRKVNDKCIHKTFQRINYAYTGSFRVCSDCGIKLD